MREETYTSTEKSYLAGESIQDAQFRAMNEEYEASDTPQGAWNKLPYWDREERPGDFEVYEFLTTTQVTRVSPPYTRSSK